MSDITKIREEAIKTQEKDIDDCNKILEKEAQKSIAIIGFCITITLWLLKEGSIFPGLILVISIILLFTGIIYSVRNLLGDTAKVHTNVESLFMKKTDDLTWEEHLQFKYLHLKEIYNTLNQLCKDKNTRVRYSIIYTIVSITFLAVTKLIPIILKFTSI